MLYVPLPLPVLPCHFLHLSNLPTRFVTPAIAEKYGFDLPEYEGVDQVVEVGPNGYKL